MVPNRIPFFGQQVYQNTFFRGRVHRNAQHHNLSRKWPRLGVPCTTGLIRLASPPSFCSKFAYVFRLSVSMRKVAGEHPFCVLIYMNSCILQICFILFILLSYLIFDFVCLTLSLANTHGISKYARTYIRDTHTQAHTQKKKTGKGKKKRKKKEGGGWGFNWGRGAWVLRRAGPHTNNARSTWMFFSFSSSAKGQTTQTTPLTMWS